MNKEQFLTKVQALNERMQDTIQKGKNLQNKMLDFSQKVDAILQKAKTKKPKK